MQQINSEVVRMVGTDVRAKLAKFFTASRVENILKLTSQGKVDQLLLDIKDACGKATGYDIQSMLDLLILLSLY